MRPLIGMLGDRREASFGAWSDVELCFVWQHYVDAIGGAGGAPVGFPPEPWLERRPELMLDAVDGLLLTGGRDIEASVYGAEPDPRNEPGDAIRDRVELALARAARERGTPILGVCRGMQLLNVVCGGGIDQHLDDPGPIHRGPPGAFVTHEVRPEPATVLGSILGSDPFTVRSHHHQGVAELGTELVVGARAPDGIVEAIEAADRERFCVAVLWHPEEDLEGGGRALYGAFVEAARAAAGEGAGARGAGVGSRA